MQSDIQTWEFQANRDYSLRARQVILTVAFAFLVGALVSGWLVARLAASPLSALDYFERALVETAQHDPMTPTRLPRSLSEPDSPLFRAYNTLVSRLWESEASRLDFFARVAHNLRSPLASITGYAELMSDPALRPPEADFEGYARLIARQAARLGQIVEQMVTAARVGEHQLDLTPAPIRLGPLLAEVVAEARQRSRRDVVFEDGLGATIVTGDALYLRQAFWNLIDNAVKFSPPETPVLVTLRRAPAPGWAEVTVADRGMGIAEADRPILFTRFGRIYNERTRGIAGSGLGLYIVKYIVDQHRGQISVHSQPGQGATFVVTLPFGSGAAPAGG